MLSEYNVSHFFWAEAINMACFYSNHLYCHQFLEKTPYEILNGESLILDTLRSFVANATS
jgi:hypothetical protein